LIAAAHDVPELVAFCGYSLSDAWNNVTESGPRVRAYAAHGAFRKLGARGLLEMLPWHLSVVESYITSGRLKPDVVLLQVAPKDDDGYYNLGPTVDYAVVAAERAREVLVEVNPNMPRVRSTRRLHESTVTGVIATDAPLAGSPNRRANEVERALAAHVAGLIPSGATIQLGASALADEVARELCALTDLRVRSGLVGDWLVDLYQAGAMASGPDTAVIGMALGTRRLYDFVADNEAVWFAPTHEIVDPTAMAACAPYVSINSAIEADLTGAINAEVVAGRYVGAVGGQVDFFRGSRFSVDGMAIVALSALHPNGDSRIVTSLQGPATSLKSDVDLVVTEFGVADLRATSLAERAERLVAVAAPQHRKELAAASLS
jgi:acyl-CoA hydrolase